MSDYRNLKVWQQTLDVVAQVYKITSHFPNHEQYGLTNQIRRAATSVALNIAEGATSGYNVEYARFLRIAIRSANEVSAGFEIAKRLDYCTGEVAQAEIEELDHIAAMLQNLIKSLGKASEESEAYITDSSKQFDADSARNDQQ